MDESEVGVCRENGSVEENDPDIYAHSRHAVRVTLDALAQDLAAGGAESLCAVFMGGCFSEELGERERSVAGADAHESALVGCYGGRVVVREGGCVAVCAASKVLLRLLEAMLATGWGDVALQEALLGDERGLTSGVD